MSNSSTEELVEFNEDIFKLNKVDDSYELNIISKKEFDTFSLTVKVVPKYYETYDAIVQDDYSHTSGYNFQIPIQTTNNYKRGLRKLWRSSIDRSIAINMNFCKILVGNRKDGEVKLKLIKGDTKASYSIASNELGYFTGYAVADGADGAAGNNYKLSLSQLLSEDIITGARVEVFENSDYMFANNIHKSPHESNVIISVSDLISLVDEEDSSKRFIDYPTLVGSRVLVSNMPLMIQPVDGNTIKIIIELYLNNKLYARSFPKKIVYDLKTPAFTISKPDGSGGYEIINAYYKLGICALDGSSKSSEKLLNSFIKKSCLIVHQIDYAINTDYIYYTFAIKPKTEYIEDDLFYSVSEKPQLLDKVSIITDRNHLICSASLRPIVEINSSDQPKICYSEHYTWTHLMQTMNQSLL